jgi:hypothetical protein
MARNLTTPPPPAPPDPNRDPLTGEPGCHPVGTSIGAATGGATGAAIGLGAGPVGVVIGTVVGAIVGGYAGREVAEGIDPTLEDAYWRENHPAQPYAKENRTYDDYASAYRTGYTGFRRDQSFEEREADLRRTYEEPLPKAPAGTQNIASSQNVTDHSSSRLSWEEVRQAARAAYQRLEREQVRKPGDSDPLPPNPGQIG